MKLHGKTKLYLSGILAIIAGALFINVSQCSATQLSYSPMRQEKILVPGTIDDLTLTLAVPADAEEPTKYELEIRPFYVDDDNITHYEAKDDYSQIVNWITLPETGGTLQPNEYKDINLTIKVPTNAPAGGQYAAIIIRTSDGNDTGIKQVYEMTQPIYAEVAGKTVHQGEITKLELPKFLFSGNITGSAAVKNLGNVHANVKHTLKVYPLFGSDEEYYTNEESPQENMVMPGATRYSSVSWENTPYFGFFRVKYSVEFEGVKNDLERIVIICPLWLTFVFVAIVILIIIKFILGAKKKNKED